MAAIDVTKLEKLSVSQRDALKQQVETQEEQLKNPENLEAAGQNAISEMQTDIAKKRDLLERDDQLRAVSGEKDRMAARKKEIERIIVPEMPTHNEMWAKAGTEESDRAVQKNLRFTRKYATLVREWQILAKRLEPDDPWAQSIETIRPKL